MFIVKKIFNHTFLYCKSCYNKKRRDTNEKKRGCKARFQSPDSNLRWISLYSNRTRMKTKTEKNRVDYEFMYNLWKKQNGQCYYSGLNMETPKKGRKRTMYAASIDRTDNNKGYTKDNVVWCCWFYNQAKSNLPQYEFIKLCSLVEHHLKNQQ